MVLNMRAFWPSALLLTAWVVGTAISGAPLRSEFHPQVGEAQVSEEEVYTDSWYAFPPYPLAHERFGVNLVGSASTITRYDVAALGVGWYLNWDIAVNPPHPNGIGFLQTIRLFQGSLTGYQSQAVIRAALRDNPGAIWQIGNEPDSIWLDHCTPEQYARAYHTYYHFVKAHDPTALVAFGGLVQGTPLRMRYLDLVWQRYRDFYGEEMPVDVWVVHGFIFPEVRGGWGADIPPGMEAYADLGVNREIREHDDMGIFVEQIVRFRQWMADHGQRDKPLLVNEYGITIWPDIIDEDGEDFSDDRVIAFMHATFDYFLTATDAQIGYPDDGDRLVQGWAWYSLDDNVYHDGQMIGEGYNGDLFFGPTVKELTGLGQGFADYVHNQVGIGPAYTDLAPRRLQSIPSVPFWSEGDGITLTVEVINTGQQPAQDIAVQFWEGEPGDGVLIGSPQIVSEVPGRYAGVGQATIIWSPPDSGAYELWVVVDSSDAVVEADEGNNRLSRIVLVATERVFLPLVMATSGELS